MQTRDQQEPFVIEELTESGLLDAECCHLTSLTISVADDRLEASAPPATTD